MGRDWVPHYADVYMAKFEKKAFYKATLKHIQSIVTQIIHLWWGHTVKGHFMDF